VISCLFHILKKYSFSQLTLSVFLPFICFVHDQEQPPEVVRDSMAEDQDFLNETITQFGPPVDYKKLGLPGPQILTDREKLSDMNTITNGLPGPFILK
jgi:hypothetical protein